MLLIILILIVISVLLIILLKGLKSRNELHYKFVKWPIKQQLLCLLFTLSPVALFMVLFVLYGLEDPLRTNAIIYLLFTLYFIFYIFYEHRKRGKILLDFGRSRSSIIFIFAGFIFLVGNLYLSFSKNFSDVFSSIMGFNSIVMIMIGFWKNGIYEKGLTGKESNGFIPWKNVTSYSWKCDESESITQGNFLQFETKYTTFSPSAIYSIPIPQNFIEAIKNILNQKTNCV